MTYKSCVGGNSYCCYDYCFILYKLATMRPLGQHPPHPEEYTDTLFLDGGPALTTGSVGLFKF